MFDFISVIGYVRSNGAFSGARRRFRVIVYEHNRLSWLAFNAGSVCYEAFVTFPNRFWTKPISCSVIGYCFYIHTGCRMDVWEYEELANHSGGGGICVNTGGKRPKLSRPQVTLLSKV